MTQYVREQVGSHDIIQNGIETSGADTGEIAQFGIEDYKRVSYLCKAAGDSEVETT